MQNLDINKLKNVLDLSGNPALVGKLNEIGIPINATTEGNLHVTDNKRLVEVIKLDMASIRDKELYEIPFNEISFNIVNSPISIYLDEDNERKKLSITRPTTISTTVDKFYISNDIGTGLVEIWLWK